MMRPASRVPLVLVVGSTIAVAIAVTAFLLLVARCATAFAGRALPLS